MSFDHNYSIFINKLHASLTAHNINCSLSDIEFSNIALNQIRSGNFDRSIHEYRDLLSRLLSDKLTSSHCFLEKPYVRFIPFEKCQFDGFFIAIINNQSSEWYGTEETVKSFDFLYEDGKGYFSNCERFLDLGGHQLIWSTYYAKLGGTLEVVSYEPSILNVAIGLYNVFINGVVNKIKVVPFAILSSATVAPDADKEKMLIDFMSTPLKAIPFDATESNSYDFVKVDIEGYEFELLEDPIFQSILKSAKWTHLELHLGHRTTSLTVDDWIRRLTSAGVAGDELYSSIELYEFLRC